VGLYARPGPLAKRLAVRTDPLPPRADVAPVVTRCSHEGYAQVVEESPEQQAGMARDAATVTPNPR